VLVELQKQTPGRITLVVADSGPGLLQTAKAIAANHATGDVRSKEGTGLGLVIVSNVVRAHGGSVQTTVSEWGGACFSLDFPAGS
jgi:two-component system C4-dicarboxylate transport sensor histidine kinase DctB